MRKEEGGWRWVVLAATYLGAMTFAMCFFSVGAMYVDLLDKFHEDELKTSIAGTINTSLFCFLAPLASALCNRFGCRTPIVCGGFIMGMSLFLSGFANSVDVLIVTYGIFGGIGNALALNPLTVVVGYYFDKHTRLILSVVVVFIGLGLFVSTPVTFALLNRYSVSGAFMILGGILLNACVVGCICRPSDLELKLIRTRQERHSGQTEKLLEDSNSSPCKCITSLYKVFNMRLLLRTDFLAYLLSNSAWGYILGMCQMHLPNFFAKDLHMDIQSISITMTCFGISNTVGRLSGAMSAGMNNFDHIGVNSIALLLCGVYVVMFPLYNSVVVVTYLLTIVTGFVTGFCNGLMPCISMKLLGLEEFASSNGLTYFSNGIGMVTGPIITGYLVNMFNSYDISFVITGTISLVGGVCSLYTMVVQRWKLKTHFPCCQTENPLPVLSN